MTHELQSIRFTSIPCSTYSFRYSASQFAPSVWALVTLVVVLGAFTDIVVLFRNSTIEHILAVKRQKIMETETKETMHTDDDIVSRTIKWRKSSENFPRRR